MFHHFDRSVVIGLHRIDAFYEHINRDNRVDLFRAIDASKCLPPPFWGKEIPALWACGESHRQVIARALSDGKNSILVMEDDCRFTPESVGSLDYAMDELPGNWDGLMLGGQISVHDGKTTPITKHISFCNGHVERLHCYALSRSGMQKFHDILCEPTSEPNDYRWGRAQAEGTLKVYRCEPFIAYQADGKSSISGRVEPARIWDDRVDVRVRSPQEIPIISLVCPFSVMDRLRENGIVSNGGESPPFNSQTMPGRVEKGEIDIAKLTCGMFKSNPELAKASVDKLRADAAFHRNAVFAIWHPSEAMPYPGARLVRSRTYEDAERQISGITTAPTTE